MTDFFEVTFACDDDTVFQAHKMTYRKVNDGLIKDCHTLEIDPEQLLTYQIRDVIVKYRKKAREVHPDKFSNATEGEKKAKTADFQELNNAYERVLKFLLESKKNFPDDPVKETADDDEKFME